MDWAIRRLPCPPNDLNETSTMNDHHSAEVPTDGSVVSDAYSDPDKVASQADVDMLKLTLDLSRMELAATEAAVLDIRQTMKDNFLDMQKEITDMQWKQAQVLEMGLHNLLEEERSRRSAETTALCLRLDAIERLQMPEDHLHNITIKEDAETEAGHSTLFTVPESEPALGDDVMNGDSRMKADSTQDYVAHLVQALVNEQRRSAEFLESARRSADAVRDASIKTELVEQEFQKTMDEMYISSQQKCISGSLELGDVLSEHMSSTISGLRADLQDKLMTRCDETEALAAAVESSMKAEFERIATELDTRILKLESMPGTDQLTTRFFALQAESSRTSHALAELEERLASKSFNGHRARDLQDPLCRSSSPVSGCIHTCEDHHLMDQRSQIAPDSQEGTSRRDRDNPSQHFSSTIQHQSDHPAISPDTHCDLYALGDYDGHEWYRQRFDEVELCPSASQLGSCDLDGSRLGCGPAMPQVQTTLKIVPPNDSGKKDSKDAHDIGKIRMATIPGPGLTHQALHSLSSQDLKDPGDSVNTNLTQSKSMPVIPPVDLRKAAEFASQKVFDSNMRFDSVDQNSQKLYPSHGRERNSSPRRRHANLQPSTRSKGPHQKSTHQLSAASVPVTQPAAKHSGFRARMALASSVFRGSSADGSRSGSRVNCLDLVASSVPSSRDHSSWSPIANETNRISPTASASPPTLPARGVWPAITFTEVHSTGAVLDAAGEDYMRNAVLGVRLPVSARTAATPQEPIQAGPATHRGCSSHRGMPGGRHL